MGDALSVRGGGAGRVKGGSRGSAVGGGGAEDGKEDLHEGVVGVVVGGPLAVDDGGEGGGVGAFFEG